MSDVFISYARPDRPKAKALAEALATRGWSVWWDPKVPPGKAYDQVIEDVLQKTRCVIVLWSKKSVVSDWVKAEAAEGKQRGMLIPATIEDDVRIPLEFRRLQAARLTDWDGKDSRHTEFIALVNSIKDLVGESIRRSYQKSRHKSNQTEQNARTTGSSNAESPEGTWIDTKTDLMWTINDNGNDVNWKEAATYAKELRVGGFSDWRLPTIEELERLHDSKRGTKFHNVRKPFNLSGLWVWSSSMESSASAWDFNFSSGRRARTHLSHSLMGRALCVRHCIK